MKIFKKDSKIELALQEIEDVLEKHDMQISLNMGGLSVSLGDGLACDIIDIETKGVCESLPRVMNTERLVIDE